MVAIVTGQGLGLERSSALVLGSRAQLGSSSLGRTNESVYVNAANGNLILTNRDEVLIGRGPDSFINRTYNSQGLLDDDNGDNWRISTHRRVYGLTGTLNQAGSTVRRVDWDGSNVKYEWDGLRNAYVSTAGSGAYDTITRADANSATPWIWTDGDSQFSERYDAANGGRITERWDTERDSSGNPTNKNIYGYDASGRLNRVTTADGNFTDLVWDNTAGKTNNLLMLTTSYTDTQTNTTKYLTRTRYTYDASNRMETVIVDLTPEHASGAASGAIADGRVYATTYSYDGTSRRIASITQTDGTLLQFTYVLVGSGYRISNFVQTAETGVTRTTSFVYDTSNRTTAITDPANVVTSITYDSAFNLVRQSVAPVAGGAEQITTYAYVGGATNLLLRSAELNNASWVGTSVTILANDPARPTPNGGTSTAERLTFTGTNNKLVQNLSGLTDGIRYLADIWVYSATATNVKWGLLQGTQSPATFAVAAGVWTRLRAELIYTAGSTSRRVELAGVNGGVIWATQAQVRREAESDLYVETAGSAIIPTIISDDVTIIRRFDGASNAGADNWSEREDFTYDARGNLIKRGDGTGNTTEYSYTAANQRETATQYLTPDPDGVAGSGVASNPIVTRYVYDDAGNNGVTDQGSTYVGSDITDVLEQHLRFLVSAEGRVTEYRYNAEGQLIAIINYAGNAYTGPTYAEKALSDWVGLLTASDQMQAQRVDYIYDFRGSIQQETQWSRTTGTGAGDAGQDWSRVDYIYDQYGLLLRKLQSGTAAGFVVPNPVSETYVYDGMGRVISFKDSGNYTTTTSYLDAQSKTLVAFANGAITTSRYNRAGELVSSVETTGVTQLNVLPASITGWNTSGEFNGDGSGGPPRSRITIKNNTHYSVTSSPTNVVAGDQITWRITLRQLGTLSTTELWAWATGSNYGTADLSSARIVDGPGNIAQSSPGKFTLQGLSQSDYTTIEVTRIFTQAESYTPQIYTYMGSIPSGNSQGIVVVNDMAVTKTSHTQTLFKYDNLGRLRVVVEPTGVKSHFLYDQLGRKVGEVDSDGSLTEYKYDATDRIIASVRYATAVSATNLTDLGDPNTTKTIANIRPTSLSTDRWSWNIYDKAGQLIQTIDAAGAVAVLSYDGAGRLTSTTRYATALLTTVVNGYRTTPPAQVVLTLPAADAGKDRIARSYFDNDGLLIGSVDAENFVTEYFYDKAGRKVGTIGYANATSTAISASTLWSAVKSGIIADSAIAPKNIHNYWLYDGRGLVGAMVDGEGNVIRYAYSAQGQVFRETIGNKVDISAYIALSQAQRTLADLDTRYIGSPVLDVTNFEYDVRNLVSKRQRMLAASKVETTDYVYDSMGRLVSETVSETGFADTRTQRSRYDLGGRLIGSLGGVGSATLSTTPTDAQLAGAIALYGTRYVYDAVGRITQKITPQGTDATGIKTVYYYDQDGQLRYEVNVLGEVTEYKYDVLEDRTEVIVYGTRMGSPSSLMGGLLTTATLAGVTADAAKDSRTQFEYDNRALLKASKGPLWTSSAPGLHVVNNQYNSFGELDASWHMPQSDQADRTETLYNRRGLQSTVTRLLNGVATGAVVTGYSYDAFARLTRQDDNLTLGRGVAYEYDRAGRLTKEWENPDKSGGYRRFVYDTRSNQIELYDHGNNKTSFQFDQFNRTIITTTPGLIATTVEQNAYGQTIEITTPGTYFENGLPRTTTYSYDENGNVLSAGDGIAITTTIYDNAGRVKESKSRINATSETLTKITFDAVGRVYEEIKDPTGLNLVTRYEYDAMGQQIRITDARNVVTRIDYDLAGQKVRVVQDEGAGKLNLTTDFTYRADSKVETVIEGVGTTAARTTKYEYDSMGRLERERVDPYGLNVTTRSFYDVNNNIVAVEDELNFKTHFVYDKENRQMLSVGAEGEVVETGYDAEGRVAWTLAYAKRIAASTVAGWTPGVSSTDVTNGLNAAPATLIADRIVRTIYDKDGRRAYAIDGEGFVTYFKYDGANSITATRVYEQAYLTGAHSQSALDLYYGNGTAPAQPSRLFAETRFAYDKASRLISTIDAENFSESYEYDDVGNRTKLTNKLGGIANYVYDAVGRLTHEKISATTYDVNGTPRNGEFTKNHYVYDAVGNLKDHYEAYGLPEQRLTSYTHDNANRMLSKTGKAFNGTLVSESYQYDARGNVTLVSGPMDAKTYSRYDAANRRVEQVVAVNGTQGALTRWTYFATGEVDTQKSWSALVSLSDAANGTVSANPAGTVRETRFEYDRNGQLVAQKIPNIRIGAWNGTAYVSAAQTLLVAVQYAYDAFGNVVKETDGNGNETHHWYDRNGRETRKLDAEGYVTTWARDEDGNVTSERRFAVKYTGGLADIAGHPTHGDDRVTSFEYDKNGQRKSETRLGVGSYTVSATGALSLGQSDAGIQYAYNGLGLVTQKTEANGDIVKSDYDSYGRLNWQRDPGFTDFGGFTAHHQTSFYYDALGNLVRSVENGVSNTGGALASYGTGTERVTRYQHQNGFLAWQEDATSFRTSFDYDLAGRATVSDRVERQLAGGGTQAEATRRAYDAAGRVTSEQRVTISGTIETSFGPGTIYTYNAFGEVDAKLVGGVTVEQFAYDSASRVIKTNSGDGTWKFFVYDGNGNATLTLSARGQLSGSTTGGIDVSGYDQLAAYNSVTGGASSLALTSFAQSALLASVAAYDKRNMATASHEPGREATGATQTISRSQTYNAFGEVASETDARGYTADYSYNKMGRVVRKIAAAVQMTRENGETVWIRPAEDYYYDISGRLVGTRDAQDLDLDSGATFDWSYDLTATAGTNSANAALKKANRGYLTTRILLAGTGHEGSEALIVSEYRPDSSVWSNGYDAFGDARRLSDGLNRITTQGFDKAGRVTQITRPATTAGTLIDNYAYDGLGRKLTAWNSLYGVSDAATTDYDALGRVISQRAQGGDVTTISYVYNSTLGSGTTLGTFGGWVETTTYANTKTSISKTDNFGRELEKTDMGGHITTFAYDRAGRLSSQTTGAVVQSFAYFNTGQLASNSGPNGTETYTYDANGNRLSEYLQNGNFVKNSAASYDALGRLATWNEYDTVSLPSASTLNSYDAVGNIRRTQATHYNINAYGDPNGLAPQRDYWYRFDALNRVVVDKGVLEGGVIVRGDEGSALSYDAAGQRKTRIYSGAHRLVNVWTQDAGGFDINNGDPIAGWHSYGIEPPTLETYDYSSTGQLLIVHAAEGTPYVQNSGAMFYRQDGSTYYENYEILISSPTGTGGLKGSFQYDLLGRQILQQDFGSYGTNFSRTASYNAKNQLISDEVTTKKNQYGNNLVDTFTTATSYDYGTGLAYALGSVVSQTATNTKLASGSTNWSNEPGTLTQTSHVWWDGAVQSAVFYDSDTGDSNTIATVTASNNFGSSTKVFKTSYALNGIGQLTGAQVRDGLPKDVAYTLDGLGQIVRRKEVRTTGNNTGLGPNELFYRFAGKQMGMVGNNGTVDVGYAQSVADRSRGTPDPTASTAGIFRNGTNTGSSFYADFSQSLDPYNSGQQGSAGGGTYTVRSGDSLQGIAAALYGDGNLWYRIAEANGLSAGAALSEGQSLILPAGVTKSTHNASTFQPYDASEALGDTLPTTPKPPKTPKCGAFGQFIVAAIAIAVVALTQQYQIFAALGPVLGGAAGAAAGSIVSQGFGVATGIQDKFSFKNVALSALSGAVGAGVGQIAGTGAVAGSQLVGDVLRGAAGSALTQGIATATGLQNKFSWTGVAVAGIGAGIAGAVTRGLSKGDFAAEATDVKINGRAVTLARGSWIAEGDPSFGAQFAATMADTIAQAATRSAIKGNSFGDNLIASLPSALGNLAGRALAAGVGTAFDGKSSGDNAKTAHSVNDPLKVETPVGNAGAQAGADSTSANGGQVDEDIIVNAMRLSPDEKRSQITDMMLGGMRFYKQPWEGEPLEPGSHWHRVGNTKNRINGYDDDHPKPVPKKPSADESATEKLRAKAKLAAASHAEFQARMDQIIANLDVQDYVELIEVDVYTIKQAVNYDDIGGSFQGSLTDLIGPGLDLSSPGLFGINNYTDGVRDYTNADDVPGTFALGDGTTFTGSQRELSQYRTQQSFNRFNQRLSSGPASGLAVTLSWYAGGDGAAQERAFNAFAPLDGPMMAAAGGRPQSTGPVWVPNYSRYSITRPPNYPTASPITRPGQYNNMFSPTVLRGERGALGEWKAAQTFARAGYSELPARLSRNNGFDGVFVKYGQSGQPIDIVINESKFALYGRAGYSNTNMGSQMSQGWIDGNIRNMMRSNDPSVEATGYLLRENRNLIRLKTNVLNGQGNNRWNRLDPYGVNNPMPYRPSPFGSRER